jgi:hypothetical protein
MPSQTTSRLFERAGEIDAQMKIEIANSRELCKQSEALLDRLHDGLGELHDMEGRSYARLAESRRWRRAGATSSATS